MESFPAQRVESGQQISAEPADEHTEATPLLLPGVQNDPKSPHISWVPPPGFLWIEIAIFSNVFLSGFDGTITASTYAVIGSEFNAANTISWLTTSYLITSTAFQPLYGRFSDILGRRTCFFTATITFLLGCLGCGLSPDVISLNLMRALTGLGGGGLMTMATIINSDMIPFKERGMYQACQNVLHGFGSICGASIGGWIADTIGWRWCFLCQVPVSIFAFVVGYYVIDDKRTLEVSVEQSEEPEPVVKASLWKQIDLSGAILLVLGLSAQLAALSMGGNNYTWTDIRVIISLVISAVLLVLFVIIEIRTNAIPVMPMSMLKGQLAISNLISNICVGMAAYSFLFMIPLFFQVVLQDSPSQAGLRLVVPSLATPVGGLIAGIVMSRVGKLSWLVRMGCFLMMLGNGLVASLQFTESARWKYVLYLIPANLGQGMAYPGILFTFLAAFDHSQQAVSTSMVYLFRSLGTVWGVAASSAIIQNVLSSQLPLALSGVPNKEQIIDEIRHSITVLDTLPVEIQSIARHIYYNALVHSFQVSTAVGAIAFISAFFARGGNLNRK
ncbi:putative transporter [Lachnellula cervina]|uniref:Putative transporter n=1 Tax=Lachnellula cervina TaxID=1316786 RepID=A0A7D8Z3J2_9HELO|nr:putative transporter [Lachnellula cervina]